MRIFFFLILASIGFQPAMAEDAHPPKDAAFDRDGVVKLTCAVGGDQLKIELTNQGREPITIDERLVFGITLTFKTASGDLTRPKTTNTILKQPSKPEFESRLKTIEPGTTVVRLIDLRKPFVEFGYAIGVLSLGNTEYRISSYENLAELPRKDYAEIRVEYHIPADYIDALTQYTGDSPKLRSLYRGPASAVASKSK